MEPTSQEWTWVWTADRNARHGICMPLFVGHCNPTCSLQAEVSPQEHHHISTHVGEQVQTSTYQAWHTCSPTWAWQTPVQGFEQVALERYAQSISWWTDIHGTILQLLIILRSIWWHSARIQVGKLVLGVFHASYKLPVLLAHIFTQHRFSGLWLRENFVHYQEVMYNPIGTSLCSKKCKFGQWLTHKGVKNFTIDFDQDLRLNSKKNKHFLTWIIHTFFIYPCGNGWSQHIN